MAMQVMDFVGREDLVERGIAAITAPTEAAEETNFRWATSTHYFFDSQQLFRMNIYVSSSLIVSFFPSKVGIAS